MKTLALWFFLGSALFVSLFLQSQIAKIFEGQAFKEKSAGVEDLGYVTSLVGHASRTVFSGMEEVRTKVAEMLIYDSAQGGIPREEEFQEPLSRSNRKRESPIKPEKLKAGRESSKRESSSDPCNGGGRQVDVNVTEYVCTTGETLNQTSFEASGLLTCTECNQTEGCSDCCDPRIMAATECICSPERKGNQCQDYEPYNCFFTLLSPSSSCNDSNPQKENLNDDCWKFSTKDKLKLEYLLHCEFENPDLDFDAYVRNGTIPPKATSLLLQVYNFCSLTDHSLSPAVVLSRNQWLGRSNITFVLNFAKITQSSRHVSGGRLYFETRFLKEADLPGLSNHPVDKHMVDFTDWKHSTKRAGLDAGAIAAIVISSVFGTVILAGAIYFFKFKRSAKVTPS